MKFEKYLKDKINNIIIFIFFFSLINILLIVFDVKNELIIFISFLLLVMGILLLLIEYVRKKSFYKKLISTLNGLDQKYLLIELLEEPSFYEGKIIYNSLYDINKSYIEKLNEYKRLTNSFKEYVEIWIHEIKLPISTMVLLNHNHKMDKKIDNQLKKIDYYIDQVLYYVRSENSSNDYIIKENNIKKIVNNVLLKNKDDILENNIELIVNVDDNYIFTDSKWLEFIINQIINNSIKYKKENGLIKLEYKNNKLSIYDNGIGIKKSDLVRVFDKMFTGENGRNSVKSTGMGLYIVKEMCNKLGHKIEIESVEGEYTNILLSFGQNEFYNVTKM